jgi:hypothetical protein
MPRAAAAPADNLHANLTSAPLLSLLLILFLGRGVRTRRGSSHGLSSISRN